MCLRRDPNLVVNHITIRFIENPQNSILLNNNQNKRDFRENEIHVLREKKKLNTIIVKKLNILSETADSSNSNYNNIFRELYR